MYKNQRLTYNTIHRTNRQKIRVKKYKVLHSKIKILQIFKWFINENETIPQRENSNTCTKIIKQIISNIDTIIEGTLHILEADNNEEDKIEVINTPIHLIPKYKNLRRMLQKLDGEGEIDDEDIESSRGWPTFNPMQKQCIVWHNGEKVNKSNERDMQETQIQSHKEQQLVPSTASWNKTFLTILSINIPHYNIKSQSFNVMRELAERFEEIDIFLLSELYWHEEYLHVQKPPGYEIIWNKQGRIKSAAIMYKTILGDTVKDISTCMMAGIEVKWDKKHSEKMYAVYHTQSRIYTDLFTQHDCHGVTAAEQYSKKILHEICSKSEVGNIIISGDVNWNINETGRAKTRPYEKLAMQQINDTNLYNVWGDKPSFPTRNGYSTLDVCLTGATSSLRNFDMQMSGLENISDHYGGIFEIPYNMGIRRRKYITFRQKTFQYKITDIRANRICSYQYEDTDNPFTTNYNQMQINANVIYEENIKYLENVDQIEPEDVQNIYEAIQTLSDKTNPIKTISVVGKKIQKLRTPEYIKMRREANAEYKALHEMGLRPQDSHKLTRLNKQLKLANQKMTRHAWKNKISERIIAKKMNWSFVQEFRNNNTTIPDVLVEDDFALHFLQLMYDYTPLENLPQRSEITKNDPNKYSPILPILPETTDPNTSLKKHIFGISASEHSAGPDGITLAFLRLLPEKYYVIISKYITSLLMHGLYQKEFREAKCSAIFKRNDRTIAKNYRPIQIVSTMCNLVERIFAYQSTTFAVQKGFLSEGSYGFQAGKSTGMLISKMGRYFYSKKSTRKTVHVILVTDLSNAFGSPDDLAIMHKFSKYYNEDALRVMRSFLIQPTCRVEMNGKQSCEYDASRRGFSQGSNKSPYAYVQLFADCHDVFRDSTKMLSFADDATILESDENMQELKIKTQEAMDRFDKYCRSYNIKVNPTKTFVKVFGRKITKQEKDEFIIKLGEHTLSVEEDVNILGVHYNKAIRRQLHINKTTNKMKGYNALIGQFSKYTDTKMIRIMIQSYHYGKFNYATSYMGRFTFEQYHQTQVVINKLGRRHFVKRSEWKLPFHSRQRIHQHEIMNRARLMTIANNHRKNQMMSLGKLAESCFPIQEFEDLISCICVKINRRQKSKRFLPIIHNGSGNKNCNAARQLEYSPFCWSEEYEKLPEPIRSNLGTKLFRPAIKRYYSERCQHNEYQQHQCLSCMENTRIYSDPLLVANVRQQWYRKNEPNVVSNLLEQFDTWADVINTMEDYEFYKYFQLTTNEFDFITWEDSIFLKKLHSMGWFDGAGNHPNHARSTNSAHNKNVGKRFRLFAKKNHTIARPIS